MAGSFTALLGLAIAAYVALMYGLAFWARRRIRHKEDFLVAGRRLPLSIAWMTLLATWFGAGTLLTAADEVRHEGIQRAALDPFGAGLCLLLAGIFFARPLWRMGLLTICDFYRRKFGRTAEVVSAFIMVPGYFGWIAAQFHALASVLQLFFGLPLQWGILLVAVVGAGYTLLGGMWSVALTDAVQIALVLAGLLVLSWIALIQLGQGNVFGGLERITQETPSSMLQPIPLGNVHQFLLWLDVLCIGALGNLPGQDLMQRVFAARSERTAQNACLIAGAAYLLFGLAPILLGLAAAIAAPEHQQSVLPVLAKLFFHPVVAMIFVIVLMSAVLSTIDSAILSPSSVMVENLLPRLRIKGSDSLGAHRVAVVLTAAASLGLAYAGEDAYELLEGAYAIGLTGLFVPLVMGMATKPQSGAAATASMVVGAGLHAAHYIAGWQDYFCEGWLAPIGWRAPQALTIMAIAWLVYLVVYRFRRRRAGL